jgi:ketosteroid isomerase-like protein
MKRSWIQIGLLLTLVFAISGCGDTADSVNSTVNKPVDSSADGAKPDTAKIEAEIRKLVKDVEASMAKNDADAFDRGTTENYAFVGPDGSIISRAERAKSIRSGDSKFDSIVYDEISVRVNPEGNGAVVVGRATVKGTNMGQKVDGAFRFSQVWSKTADGWKVAHGHVTPIAAGQQTKSESDKDERKPESSENK